MIGPFFAILVLPLFWGEVPIRCDRFFDDFVTLLVLLGGTGATCAPEVVQVDPRPRFLSLFLGFWSPFGEPWALISGTFWTLVSARFWCRFRERIFVAFATILGAFFESFSSLFGDPWI